MATNTNGGTTASLANTPQAKDDFYVAGEDQILYFNVMANDLGGNAKMLWSIDNTSDDGANDLIARDVASVIEYSELGARISLTSDGRIKYDTTLLDGLAAGQIVTDQFTYAIRMSNGTLSWATVTVTLTGTNDAPVALDDNASGNEDTNISGSVAVNDSDVDAGAVLSYAVDGAPPAGFAMDGDGSWSLDATNAAYQHIAQGAYEDVVVSYMVTDEHGATDTATLTIRVYGVNDDPVALDDNGSGNEDSLISGSVATNDDDVDDGATLGYAVNGSAPAGFDMDGDGNWSLDASNAAYQHIAQGAYEDVVVSYTVTDEFGGSDIASLTIRVYGVNDDPVAGDDNSSGNEDGLISGSVATNDDDADDGATLSYSINGAAPAGFLMDGDGNWSLDASNAAYQHIAQGAYEDVVVSYTVTDEFGGSDTASLTVRVYGVNDDPVAVDDNGSGNEDSLLSGTVATNDDDVDDGATLSYAINGAAPAGFLMDGDGNWSLDASDAAYQHIAQGAYEDVVVSYTVTDEHGAADTATLTIRVYGVNDDPVALDDNGSGSEDSLISGSVAANDDDVDDGATLSYAVNGSAPAGFDMAGDGNWSLDASDAAYQHIAQGAYEDVVVSYTVTDELGGNDTASLTIRVYGVNDDPVALDDNGSGNEDSLISGSVAANDDDADDGATLSYAVNGAAPADFLMDGDGNWSLDASHAAYQHIAQGAYEDVVVAYAVTDEHGASDTATLTVRVYGANDGPDAQPVTLAAMAEDSGARLITQAELLAGATDVDGDTLTITSLSIASGNGSLVDNGNGTWSYTPALNDDTSVTFSYTASDGSLTDSSTATLDITPVNDAPVNAVPGAQTVNAATATAISGVSVSDVDSASVTAMLSVLHGVVSVATGGGATIGGNGTSSVTVSGTLAQVNAAIAGLTYTGASGYSGPDTLTVSTSDGSLTDVDGVAITVNAASAAPTANNDAWVLSDLTPLPSATITAAWFLNNDTDADSPSLFVTNVAGLPVGMTANYDGAGHLVDITGTSPAAGSFTLTYTMTDGVTSTTASVSVTVLNTTSGVDTFSLNGNDFSYIDLLQGGDTMTGDAVLTGNAGIDVFIGNNGNDTLSGGAGNDKLFGNENIDTLNGGEGNDLLDGGNGTDTLNGGLGNDILTGGTANDIFIFNSALGSGNVDTVTDFDANGNDKIHLDDAIFAAIGAALAANEFVANAGGIAGDANDFILYDTATGNLYYDADGNGAGGRVLFAQLTLAGLTGTVDATDFGII